MADFEDIELENDQVCPNCGHKCDGATECPNCGAILESEDEFDGFQEDEEF